MSKSTLDVLTEAYHLLDDKRRWTTGENARDEFGLYAAPSSRYAVSWCASGAIQRFVFDSHNQEECLDLLSAQCGDEIIPDVNDGPDGYRRIRAAFRKAIRQLGGTP